jgi:hypothetical protein
VGGLIVRIDDHGTTVAERSSAASCADIETPGFSVKHFFEKIITF